MIEFQNVTKKYSKMIVLDRVNFKIKRGEFISVVGPSGAGKSTLIKMLICEESPTSGTIIVASRDITQLKLRELPFYRRKLGVVFQDFKLLPQKTVYENVAFALQVSGESGSRIRPVIPRLLEIVGLPHKIHAYPHELSGGEQQRVAIARALVHRPKILVADEPTGNLDTINTQDIMEILKKINEFGTTVVLVTHNREIVNQLRKRVVTLDHGKLVSDEQIGKYRL